MNVTGLDIYSRLLYDRIIFFGESFNDDTCNLVIAQLLYLNSLSKDDINIYIMSPGGSVAAGFGLIDTMSFIGCDVATTCLGMAASMGALLLSCGNKGKRSVLPHSRVMIHQVSSGIPQSTYADMKVSLETTKRFNDDVFALLSKNMGKSIEEIEELCNRDKWFVGQEAIDIGIADKMIKSE
jgi:ATP-dependent Clp protease protease subunit